MNIGQRIKEKRKSMGLTVDEVAKKLNKNRATIYRYESNDIENLPISILEPLAEILQTTPSYLMGWEDTELNNSETVNKDKRFMEIKDLIREKRQELGLTYEQLGELVGVGKSTVRKWETGMIENMRRDNIIALSKALNISPALLMGWDFSKTEINTSNNYSEEEQNHIEDLRKLNDIGKNKVIAYTKDLIEMPKYQKENNSKVVEMPKREKQIWEEPGKEYLMPKASHDKEGEFTEEDYKHDDDLMNDEDIWK